MPSIARFVSRARVFPVSLSRSVLDQAIESTYRREGWQSRDLDELLRLRMDLARRVYESEASA